MLRFRHEEIIVLGFGVVCWENMSRSWRLVGGDVDDVLRNLRIPP